MEDAYTKFLSPLRVQNGAVSQDWVKSVHVRPEDVERIRLDLHHLKSKIMPNSKSAEFVVHDIKNPRLFSVMFVGGVDSPYRNCLLRFLLHLSEKYPDDPPEMRFQVENLRPGVLLPNVLNRQPLLSLLGTFPQDSESETWNDSQTLASLVLSMKQLFLVSEPYYLNPVASESIGTETGRQKSKLYNCQARLISVAEGVVSVMENPPPEFAEVVQLHFLVKHDELTEQIKQWRTEAEELEKITSNSPEYFTYRDIDYKTIYDRALELLKVNREEAEKTESA